MANRPRLVSGRKADSLMIEMRADPLLATDGGDRT
jgi:hypothetical protein